MHVHVFPVPFIVCQACKRKNPTSVHFHVTTVLKTCVTIILLLLSE